MKKYSVLAFSILFLASCSEIIGFGIASVNLLFALLKIAGILLVIFLVIAMISSFFNRNN